MTARRLLHVGGERQPQSHETPHIKHSDSLISIPARREETGADAQAGRAAVDGGELLARQHSPVFNTGSINLSGLADAREA